MKWTNVEPGSFFYNNVYSKVIKQITFPKNEAIVAVPNRDRSEKLKQEVKDMYKFVFDYPEGNDSIVGIEVYKMED